MLGFRDMACAQLINMQAELGGFAKEINVYGCGYMDESEKVRYILSENATDIYDFIARDTSVVTTKPHRISNKLVLSEENEYIKYQMKVELAKKIQELYPKEWYQLLRAYKQSIPVCNDALVVLESTRERLEGRYDRNQLKAFEGLLHSAYEAKNVDKEHFLLLQRWIDNHRRQMDEDEVEIKDQKTTVYGFAAGADKVKYFVNALEENIVEGRLEKLLENELVTVVASEEYWHEASARKNTFIQDFKGKLKNLYSETYMQQLKTVKKIESPQTHAFFESQLEELERITSNQEVIADFKRYQPVK